MKPEFVADARDAEGHSRPRRGMSPVGMNAVEGSGRLSLRSVRTHEGSAPFSHRSFTQIRSIKKTAEPDDYAVFRIRGRREKAEGYPDHATA